MRLGTQVRLLSVGGRDVTGSGGGGGDGGAAAAVRRRWRRLSGGEDVAFEVTSNSGAKQAQLDALEASIKAAGADGWVRCEWVCGCVLRDVVWCA